MTPQERLLIEEAVSVVEQNYVVMSNIERLRKQDQAYRSRGEEPPTKFKDEFNKALGMQGSAIYPRYQRAMQLIDQLVTLIESHNL